jgi:PAS domain S-box-containing protein
MTRLLELGSLCAREGHDQSKCLSAVVDTAIAITGAPRGSLQRLDARSGALTLAAQHGFGASFLSYFARVPQDAPVTAAAAMRAKQRIIVEDVTKSEIFYDPARVKVLLEAGVWAVQSTPLIDADGKVFGVISTHFAEPHQPRDRELRFIDLLARQTADYLSRIHTEDALRSLQSSLEAEVKSRTRERDRIWNVSEDLLGVLNFEGYFVSINPAWQKTLGWGEDEIKALHVDDLRHPDDAAHSRAGRDQLARGASTVRMENRFRHKDGSWRWIAWTMTADQGLIYVAGRHVTVEKEAAAVLQHAQEQLANAQKMEALGQLTGGVAHDFNNIMMIVSGYAQTLKGRLEEPKHVRALQAIEAAVSRAENLTRQLLSFSRHQPLNPTVLHPADAVGAIQDVLSGSATGKIELTVDIPDDCWPICVDKSEFALALVNIALNARDAMPSGGWLSIKCENTSLQVSNNPDGLSGDFVAFRISDTGSGIAASVLPKVFDPFFTTKEVEKGTGLGLSQVYGFARRSGGSVVIQSEMQRGTIVTLYLPRSQQLISAERNQDGPRPKGSRKETILVVEDNADVRSVAIALLNELGYRTLEANSATSALSARDGRTQIDLVFSDIVLPGSIDGVSLAQEIAVRHPRISILLTTGYARRVDAELKHPVLRKPYDIIALDGALRGAIQTHKLMIEEGRVLRTQMTAMPSGKARIRR